MSNERQQRAARAEQMRKEREKADRKQRNLITVAIVVVVIALIAVGAWGIKAASDDNKVETKLTVPKDVTKDYGIVYNQEAATGTAPAADAPKPVKVVLYEDFLCPGCGALEETAGPFLAGAVASGEIELEYRPFSFLLRQSTNEYSQRAWNAAVCVYNEAGAKAFEEYHDILFANQPQEGGPGPDDAELIDFAKQAGVTGIDSCIKKRTFARWIDDAREKGQKDGVSGTPTIRVDGKDVSGADNTIATVADIQKAIDAAKKK
ncbi:DsbA family protein [Aeromicrobium wangtongii]|uniref:DsbA family protein n=1 Tax=Aeromicrobium wangtongii TaxID=2969247 RepID=A0ABY5MBY8_9ACTN|nr:thioredoxin domain-containing protein [Aeromicrobium wangtongii]MCD9197198.1 DsbA family protein [Aeromicrobium wangtongii]UUP14694.1 DsbA family protein [Aeromicrobium wangtongii]